MEKTNFDGSLDTPSNPIQRSVDSAGAALHSTIDKVADPARSTVDRVSSAAHQTVDRLASNATHAADQFSSQARRLTEAPARALNTSRSWIQDRPLESLAGALALGFVLGRLTAR